MINGVEFKKLNTYPDDRGFFRELIRSSDEFAKDEIRQISHSLVYSGIIKAWHAHLLQTQWNYIVNGLVRVALHDLRKESSTYGETMIFLSGDNQDSQVYRFPAGVAHGYKCINGPMNIIYFTSGEYDPEDEIRVAYDDAKIDFDWLRNDIR